MSWNIIRRTRSIFCAAALSAALAFGVSAAPEAVVYATEAEALDLGAQEVEETGGSTGTTSESTGGQSTGTSTGTETGSSSSSSSKDKNYDKTYKTGEEGLPVFHFAFGGMLAVILFILLAYRRIVRHGRREVSDLMRTRKD